MTNPSSTPPKSKSALKPILFGCLGLVLLSILGIAGLSYWLMQNSKDLIAEASRKVLILAIEESDIEDAQQILLTQEIDRIANAVKDELITLDEMGQLADKLVQSTVFEGLIIHSIHASHIENSGFDAEAKETAALTVHRFIRGYLNESISSETVDSTLRIISLNGGRSIKESLTDTELVAFLVAAQAAADDANISKTFESIDFAAPITALVDAALE